MLDELVDCVLRTQASSVYAHLGLVSFLGSRVASLVEEQLLRKQRCANPCT